MILAKLLIMERMLTNEGTDALSAFTDLEMLVMMHGGRERTKEEFESLLSRAGFKIESLTWTRAERYLIQAVPSR